MPDDLLLLAAKAAQAEHIAERLMWVGEGRVWDQGAEALHAA
jgi:hypothetical protein